MSEKQFYLLQVNDALFPIGGYSHSQGLETYIQRGIVHGRLVPFVLRGETVISEEYTVKILSVRR